VQYFPRSGRVRVKHLTSKRGADIATHEQRYLTGLEKAPVSGEIDLF
jgi:hypothetical protein